MAADGNLGEGAASKEAALVADLLLTHGQTFAAAAGIDLDDDPAALWQLLVLANLMSNRIRSDAAVASARELWKIGCDSAAGTRGTSWRQRVDALGRGGYRRYDFSTSTRLGENAAFVKDRWADDLRQLRRDAEGDAKKASKLLQEFNGIGPSGAGIFLREVQGVWPEFQPAADKLVTLGAAKIGLPTDPAALFALVAATDAPRLAAALVRLAKDKGYA